MIIKNATVIGFKKGVGKKSGKPYCQIFCNYPDENIIGGMGSISGFVPKSVPIDDIAVGAVYDFYVFNDRIVEAL